MSLVAFIRESNLIEGITREPTEAEITATTEFVCLPDLTIEDVEALVSVYQPDAKLRRHAGMNVRVGDYVPPPGGPSIALCLGSFLRLISNKTMVSHHDVHIYYEMLHPFTDGNGRSGRAIWLWQRNGSAPIGFLHQFYYDTLRASRQDTPSR